MPRALVRHCEERSDEAIPTDVPLSLGLPRPDFVGTRKDRRPGWIFLSLSRHCEGRSPVAISPL